MIIIEVIIVTSIILSSLLSNFPLHVSKFYHCHHHYYLYCHFCLNVSLFMCLHCIHIIITIILIIFIAIIHRVSSAIVTLYLMETSINSLSYKLQYPLQKKHVKIFLIPYPLSSPPPPPKKKTLSIIWSVYQFIISSHYCFYWVLGMLICPIAVTFKTQFLAVWNTN